MLEHRQEILEVCDAKWRSMSLQVQSDRELADALPAFFDDVADALLADPEVPARSDLPATDDRAGRVGDVSQRRGYPIRIVVRALGTISDATGEVADRHGENFEARDYRLFDLCIDAGIADGIERFWARSETERERKTNERLGSLAHEMRNTLSSGIFAFQLLRRGNVPISGKTGQVLGRSLSRMEALVAQTLAAARLDTGQAPDMRRMRLAPLLEEIEGAILSDRDVSLSVECDPAVEVVADEHLLVSAITNVVQNAFKFTRAGGSVQLRARSEPGSVVVRVEDECGGLRGVDPESLFAPFTQGGRGGRGVGLGLTITREAMLAHGGSIDVRDIPGKGCVFTLRFPDHPEVA